MERCERSKLFSHHERSVIGKHDATRAHTNALRAGCDMRNQNRGCGTGNARHVVMFRQPETLVSPFLRMSCEIECVDKGVGCRCSLGDGCKVQDGKGDHAAAPFANQVPAHMGAWTVACEWPDMPKSALGE